ncbi:MAG TPA: cytochrome P450 [Streptosporangiaceae bacterium]|nr:cytochrome P450 [Streptosporangiaceae bacterium]
MRKLLGFDPTDPNFRADPYAAYERLRETTPVLRTPSFWLLTRYDECYAVLHDARFGYPDEDPGENFFMAGFSKQRNFLIFMNPPDHTRMRRVVREGLSPKVVHALRPYVQAATNRLLDDALAGDGTFDLVKSLSHPLPFGTICELLAVPEDDRTRIHSLAADYLAGIGASFAITAEQAAKRDKALDELNAYFDRLAGERRRTPGEDILTHLVNNADTGEMSRDELLGTCVLLFVAGHGTTTNMIGNSVLALLRHPDQLDRFKNEPDLEAGAIEELLRYDSSTHQSFRVAREDVDLGNGNVVRKGEQVLVVRGAANRDPAVFDDPHRLDLGRTDVRHLSFAMGHHICLGSALARMQLRVALRTLFDRAPNLRLLEDELEYIPSLLQRGVRRLRVSA